MNVKKVAVFASGSGTNAQNIIEYFSDNKNVKIDSLWSNNPRAYALTRAASLGIDSYAFSRQQFYETDEVLRILLNRSVDLIVLAGFLWLVPDALIKNFPILNIHPALLPKYGGKGMYGMKVHQAVVDNHEKKSGISIHRVNDKYDDGALVFQAECTIDPGDSPEIVANKVHELEYKYYPLVIEQFLSENLK